MGMFDDDLDEFIYQTRKADKAEMQAAGNKIVYKGHIIEPDSECYLGYIVDGERPNGWSSIQYAKDHIDRLVGA